MKVAINILAAGSSTRMGKPKISLPVSGKNLLELVTQEAAKSKADWVIIIGGAHPIRPNVVEISPKVQLIQNEDWSHGIGSSIKCGLSFVLANMIEADAVIYLVSDQPFVTSAIIDSLIDQFENKGELVGSRYSNTIGVPALFSRSYFKQILSIKDSQGAKVILERNREKLELIDFPEGRVDLDTPEDYKTFLRDVGHREV